jgi:hypothetical protein
MSDDLSLDDITVIAHAVKIIARVSENSSEMICDECFSGVVLSEEDAGRVKRALHRMSV